VWCADVNKGDDSNNGVGPLAMSILRAPVQPNNELRGLVVGPSSFQVIPCGSGV
jgi:hypothetical protein